MRRVACCLLLLICASASSTAASASVANTWTMSGASNAYMAAIAGSPSSPGHIYAGDQTGGMWRTRDNGASWSDVSPADASTATNPVLALAVSPSDASVVIATRGCRLYASSNGGDTWQTPSGIATPPYCYNGFPVSFDQTGTAWAYVWGGLYTSADGGLNWTLVGAPPSTPGATGLVIVPGTPQVIWVGSATTDAAYTSSDGGATWQDRSQGLPAQYGGIQQLLVDPATPTTAYAVIAGMLYGTTGGSWAPAFGNIDDFGVYAMTIAPGSPETIVVAGDTTLHRSTDGGLTWTASSGGPASWYSSTEVLNFDPAAPSNIWAGGAGLFHSSDGAQTFTLLPQAVGRGTVNVLAADPNDSQQLYVGTDSNGVLRSSDGGVLWEQTGSQLIGQVRSIAVDPFTPGVLFAAAGNYVYRSQDNGDTWQALVNDVPGVNNSVVADPESSGVFYANGGALVYRTTDGGDSWTACGSTGSTTELDSVAVDPSNAAIIYAVGYGGMWRSTDTCAHWTQLTGRYAYDVSVGPDGTAYVATEELGAAAFAPGATTAIGSSTTTGYNTPLSTYAVAADPARPGVAYAGTAHGTYQTVDGGHRWTRLTLNGLSSTWSLSILVSGDTIKTATTRGIATIDLNGPSATTAEPQIQDTNLTLAGAANPDGQSAQAFFEYGATTAYGQTTTATTVGTGTDPVPVSVQISGARNTTYHYRLVVVSGDGIAVGSDQSVTIPPLPPQVSVSSPVGTGLHSTTLRGSVNPNGGSGTYHFEWGTTTSYGLASAETAISASSTSSPVSLDITGLTSGTTYHYRLVAANGGGTTTSADASFQTPAHLAPAVSLLDASGVTTGGATVNGTIDPSDADTTYHFEWGTTTSYGFSTTSAAVAAGLGTTAVAASLPDLVPATTYHYRLVATNAGGTSVSDDATLQTADRPPQMIVVGPAHLGSGQLQLGRVPLHLVWAAQAGDSPICGYDLSRTLPTPTLSIDSPLTARADDSETSGMLSYSVRANGCDSLQSDWLATAPQQLDLIQQGAAPLHYHGSWKTLAVPSASGDHVRRTTTAGSTLSYTVTGRDIALVAPDCATCSAIRVSIDGQPGKKISLYAAASAPQTIHRLASFANSGRHTVTITAIARNGHTRVDIDAVIRLT